MAKASFAPRIVAEGALLDFQQSAPRGHADLAVGGIKLEWGLFEGGKRVAELRVADSKIRAAVAQAESIADTIAFQVTEAYRHLITARRGDRSLAPGGGPGGGEPPARAAPGQARRRNVRRNHRRREHADPRPASLPQFDPRLSHRFGLALSTRWVSLRRLAACVAVTGKSDA